MEETRIFLITYVAALLGVIPPGLVNMTVAKTCVQRGKKDGLLVAIGASVIVFFQALIAVLLAQYIFNNPFVRNILLRTGLVIFVLMTIYFFVMAQRKKNKNVEVSDTTGTKSFLKGMAVAALNILPIPFFVAIGVALNVGGSADYHVFDILVFTLGASLGTFTTLYFYILFFAKIEDRANYFSRYSNYFMAILMLILVFITLIRIFL